ncbi:MAG: ABC transporter permease [Trueperaceae bacterium]|nr:MAG: ABC transporter permease [Trueperaceae bacterium]
MATRVIDAPAGAQAARPSPSMLRRAIRKFIGHPGGMVGLGLFVALVLIAVFAPVFAPYDPLRVDPIVALTPPSAEHWMGTDTLGRDVMSRVIYGTRISLRLGVVSVSIGLSLGVLIGVLAGYLGGRVDGILMRFIDMLLAFPSLILALVAVFALGPGLTNAMIAVGISSIPAFARITRGEVLSAKENLYVQSAQALGGSEVTIMIRHILPNIIAPNIVMGALMTGTAILAGAALSFLGLGAQSPTPEWGLMLSQGRGFMSLAWWLTFFPGLGIMLTVMAMNLLGDGLRDVLDPRTR